MVKSILVTYATRYGSTREVAEKIAATLRESGLTVEVHSAKQVRTLESYRAVVLGAPLYIGSWLKDAQRFLKQHQAALQSMPVAVFTLGPVRIGENPEEVRVQMDRELARYSWLKPVAVEMFGGKYDPAQMRFPDTLLRILPGSPLYQSPTTDLRDWDAIRMWASGLSGKL